jgi:hypothetical protein
MSWSYGWRPYVSVAQRRANAARELALVAAECSRVGVWLGLPVLSKPDDNTGTRGGGFDTAIR